MNNFLEIANALGHNVERLQRGEIIRSFVQVNSLDEFKQLFAGTLTQEQRAAHAMEFERLNPNGVAGDSYDDRLKRLSAHVYGQANLQTDDAEYAGKLFPITILAESAQDCTISKDIVYGPSTTPALLNYGTLTFDGGSITTLNTVLTLTANEIVFTSAQGDKNYHIGILGVKGNKGTTGPVGPTPTGQAPKGKSASAPTPGICTGADNGGTGTTGLNGGEGGKGGRGDDGLPSLNANITITTFSDPKSQLVILSQSGEGGDGGDGGAGGTGQQGGDGGDGCKSGSEGTDGGNGGTGGTGGKGGDGNDGGNGVPGNPIMVYVSSINNVVPLYLPAPPGKPGQPGTPGNGGQGGGGGAKGNKKSDGAIGATGATGATGSLGSPGMQSGNPGAIQVTPT